MRISDLSSDVCSSALVSQARGRVLESGIGTGRNLPFYDRDKLESLQGLDPAAQMHGLARKRARKADLDVELLTLPAERIQAEDASFDTVLTTFPLCTLPAARSEERRVGKEHVNTGSPRRRPDHEKKTTEPTQNKKKQ